MFHTFPFRPKLPHRLQSCCFIFNDFILKVWKFSVFWDSLHFMHDWNFFSKIFSFLRFWNIFLLCCYSSWWFPWVTNKFFSICLTFIYFYVFQPLCLKRSLGKNLLWIERFLKNFKGFTWFLRCLVIFKILNSGSKVSVKYIASISLIGLMT